MHDRHVDMSSPGLTVQDRLSEARAKDLMPQEIARSFGFQPHLVPHPRCRQDDMFLAL